MLRLRKKEIKDGIIYYYYQIENSGEWGLLWYKIDGPEYGWVTLAENDEADYPRYRYHAFTRIEEYIKNNKFPDTDLVAWG